MFRQDNSVDDNGRPMVGAWVGVHAECNHVDHKPSLPALAAESAASAFQFSSAFSVRSQNWEMIAACGLLLAIAHGFRERIYGVNDLSQVPLRLTRRVW